MPPHFIVSVTTLFVFLYGVDDFLLKDPILLLRPPTPYLGQPSLFKKVIKNLILPLILGEEQQEVFDPTLLEDTRELFDRMFGEISAEDDRDNASRHVCNTR